jgi:branched-chain amino acid transport system ATP-binding protein
VNDEAGNGATLLEVGDVVKRFGGIRAVNGATMNIGEGRITALIGPNGAGKTTLFNVLTGFYKGDRGSVRLRGQEILGDPPYEIARKGMVRTFQITKALAAMPVIDNMMLAAREQPGETLRSVFFRPRAVKAREDQVRKQAMELLGLFNLRDLADGYAGTLSGGQRKLLELARALMADPKLLLLDEPMAGTGREEGERIGAVLRSLKGRFPMVLVEHDMHAVFALADRISVLIYGKILASGTPAQVRADPQVVTAYLGEEME